MANAGETVAMAERARILESGRQTALVDRKRGMSLETMRRVRAERDRIGGDRPEWVDGYKEALQEMERDVAAKGCVCFASKRVRAFPVDRCERCGLACEGTAVIANGLGVRTAPAPKRRFRGGR